MTNELYITELTADEQMKLARLLKTYFPELGTDDEMNGGDVVQELCELYSSLPQVEE